jgi:hypothetical protein
MVAPSVRRSSALVSAMKKTTLGAPLAARFKASGYWLEQSPVTRARKEVFTGGGAAAKVGDWTMSGGNVQSTSRFPCSVQRAGETRSKLTVEGSEASIPTGARPGALGFDSASATRPSIALASGGAVPEAPPSASSEEDSLVVAGAGGSVLSTALAVRVAHP